MFLRPFLHFGLESCSSRFAVAVLFSLQLVLPAEGRSGVPQAAGQPPDEVSRPANHAVLLSLRPRVSGALPWRAHSICIIYVA